MGFVRTCSQCAFSKEIVVVEHANWQSNEQYKVLLIEDIVGQDVKHFFTYYERR